MIGKTQKYKITELVNDELAGMGILEITTIPDISILRDSPADATDYVQKYKQDFANLLAEIFQTYQVGYTAAEAHKDISIELLWLTQKAHHQPYKANIRLFFIFRAIDDSQFTLLSTLREIESICISTLALKKYDYRPLAQEEFVSLLGSISKERVSAVVKGERVENLQNQLLNACYSFDRFPETDQDLARIAAALVDYPNCMVSFQLIPTKYTAVEVDTLERMSNVLETLNRGVADKSLGHVSFALAEKHAQTYKYYERNKNSALFMFNILVIGDSQAVATLTNRVYGHINGSDPTISPEIKYINLSAENIALDTNLIPFPWAVNELILEKERDFSIWSQGETFFNYYRLPYIITAAEAAEFFRLPIGSRKITAGLVVNDASKNSKNYSSGIVNGGDITVGYLKGSVRNNTIGFFLDDLTKHMLIVGAPGSGKTTFSVGLLDRLWKEHQIPFLVFEPAKNEYRALVESIPDLQVFTPGKNFISPFIFNPFVPPRNVVLESYKSTLKTAFAAAVIMASPLDKIFEDSINNAYSEFGWMDFYTPDDGGKPFNILDFIKVFQKTFEEIGYVGDARNIGRAGYVRLHSLVPLFDTYSTIPIEDILCKPTVIELAAIENTDAKALIIALLLLGILSYVNHNYQGDGILKNVIMLEEAHVLLDADERFSGEGEANPAAIAKKLIKRMLAEMRAYGVGLIIADQSPRKVSADVVGLTNIKLAFRLVEGRDKEILANSSNMSETQVGRLARLKPGGAFLFFDKLEEPEEVNIEDYRAKQKISITITDEEIRRLSTYWNDKREVLKPYPECSFLKTCLETCDFKRRNIAREVARRIYRKGIKPDDKEFHVLKNLYASIERRTFLELNGAAPFSRELAACVKLHLLRMVKYYSAIPLTDRIIKETLCK